MPQRDRDKKDKQESRPAVRFVAHLPDLMKPEDYAAPPGVKKVRVRISVTDEGVEILSDSPYPALLEDLLAQAGVDEMEKVLCG
jgi:hypothetical protein